MVFQGRRSWSLLENVCGISCYVRSYIQPQSWERCRTEQSSVCGIRVDTVNYGKGKLALGEILGETFVRRILAHDETRQLDDKMVANLVVLKIHIVIPDLEVDPNQVDQRNVVTSIDSVFCSYSG